MSDQRPYLYVAADGIQELNIGEWLRTDAASFEFRAFLYDDERHPFFLELLAANPADVIALRDFHPQPGERIVIACEDPESKKAIVNLLAPRGAQFISAIHPSVAIGQHTTLGEGIVIDADAVIGDYCAIGALVQIGTGCTLKSGSVIGALASIQPGLSIGNRAAVGSGHVLRANLPDGATTIVLAQPPAAPATSPLGVGRRGHQGDLFAEVWTEILSWLEFDPSLGAKRLLKRLQRAYPGRFQDNQYTSLHRRLRAWRLAAPGRESPGTADPEQS